MTFFSWFNYKKTYLIYFTLNQFLKYKIHLGMFSFFLFPTLNFYILIKRFNFLFFNLNYTLIHFKLVLNLITDLVSKRFSILICNNDLNFKKYIVNNFNFFYSINFIFNKWIPGFLTNFKKIYKSILRSYNNTSSNFQQKKIKYFLYLKFLGFYLIFKFKNPPFFIFTSNIISFYNVCYESHKLKIPFLVFVI